MDDPVNPRNLTPLAARLEKTRLSVKDDVAAMSERIGISEKHYRDLLAGYPLTQQNTEAIASFLEAANTEVLQLHAGNTDEKPAPNPRWSSRRGTTTLVPVSALGKLIEDTRKALPENVSVMAMSARLHIGEGAYRSLIKGELSKTLEEKIFPVIAKHLPAFTGAATSTENIRALYNTEVADTELTVEGRPTAPLNKQLQRSSTQR